MILPGTGSLRTAGTGILAYVLRAPPGSRNTGRTMAMAQRVTRPLGHGRGLLARES
jgi:hypothetical protein